MRKIDKQGADLIFPFKDAQLYYDNKEKKVNTKGKLIFYNERLFNYLSYQKSTLNNLKKACLKWQQCIYENEDIQIG